MLRIDRRSVQHFDWMLITLTVLLVVIGFINLLSSTHALGELSNEARRQLISLGLGSIVMIVAAAIDYRHFERFALPVYGASLLLLGLTLVIAPMTRGSQSWILESTRAAAPSVVGQQSKRPRGA